MVSRDDASRDNLRRDAAGSQTTSRWKYALCGAGLLCRAHGIEKMEELLDVGDFERVMHAIAHTHQSKLPAAVLASNVGSHESANTGGIHVGDVSEINNQRAGRIGPHSRLEWKHCGKHECFIETKNALSWLASGLVVDGQGLLRHGGDINSCIIL